MSEAVRYCIVCKMSGRYVSRIIFNDGGLLTEFTSEESLAARVASKEAAERLAWLCGDGVVKRHSGQKRNCIGAEHELLAQRDQLIADSCATDTAIREACRKVLGDAADGDSVAVPPVEDLVERVVDELVELESELAGVRPHLATVLEHAERCRLGPVEVEAFRNLLTRCQ
jgi:hypothetical protein